MIDLNTVAPAGSTAPPSTRAEARGRVALIDDAITAIRTQIAAADMKRQARRGALDPDWYHRAKTAMRHLQRERALLLAQAAALPGGREQLKDRIIAILRDQHDEAAWAQIVETARQTLAEESR
jgi:hypothetical protein